VAIWKSFKKKRKFLFLASFLYYKKGNFGDRIFLFLKIIFHKTAKINSPQKEEEDCKQVPMDDRPFGYKPKTNP
jgi:hypothetical protein